MHAWGSELLQAWMFRPVGKTPGFGAWCPRLEYQQHKGNICLTHLFLKSDSSHVAQAWMERLRPHRVGIEMPTHLRKETRHLIEASAVVW